MYTIDYHYTVNKARRRHLDRLRRIATERARLLDLSARCRFFFKARRTLTPGSRDANEGASSSTKPFEIAATDASITRIQQSRMLPIFLDRHPMTFVRRPQR